MTIQKELLAIKGDGELLIAEEVVDWAKSHPDSLLHREFQWDIKKAAREHWLWQARRIIALHITFDDGERRFVSLRIDRTRDRGGFRDLGDILKDRSLYDIMLADALDDIARLEIKYKRLVELKPIWSTARAIRRKKQTKKGTKERRAQAAT